MKINLVAGIIGLAFCSSTIHAQTNPAGSHTEIRKITNMKEFILLISVPATYSGEDAKAVNPKWNIVLDKWKADSVYVTSFVFPGESSVVSGTGRSVKKETVICNNRKIVSSIILRTNSLEAAVELAKLCPILEYDGSVEVRAIQVRPAALAN